MEGKKDFSCAASVFKDRLGHVDTLTSQQREEI